MITGFEKLTKGLDAAEFKMLKIIVPKLRNNIGVKRIVASPKIIEFLKTKGYTVSRPRLRKIIRFIRIRSIIPFLVANSKGYYVASNEEDVDRYIKSLHEEAAARVHTASCLEDQKKLYSQNLIVVE